MISRIFRQALGQVGRALFLLSLGAGLFFFIGVWSTATFVTEIRDVPFLQNPPRAFRAFLGSTDFFTPQGWLASSLNHPVALALFTAAGLSVAAGGIALEVERGTIEFILSRPIRRRSFLLGKSLA
ncbi:MAG: ABC transporter permease subunit, partial [Acidimicrobiia bacterium]